MKEKYLHKSMYMNSHIQRTMHKDHLKPYMVDLHLPCNFMWHGVNIILLINCVSF